jgi:hypothetical protein
MATLGDVIAAIERVEKAGHAGNATTAARREIGGPMRSPQDYDRILDRLRASFPEIFLPSNPPPGEASEQQGVAAQAMKKAEAALSQQQSAAAEFDRQVIEALLHAHKTTAEGKKRLDDLEAQIESAVRTWDLTTAVGAREFQKYLIGKLRQIVAVVQDANDDDTSKQALAAAWTALYASLPGRDGSAPAGKDDAPAGGDDAPTERALPDPEAFPDTDADPYIDTLPVADRQPAGQSAPQPSAPTAPAIPAVPGFGGGMPSAGAMPAGGAPAGLPQADMLQALQRKTSPSQLDDGPLPYGDLISAEETPSEGPGGEETNDDAAVAEPQSGPVADPTTVTLPDGETVTATTPQLAAVMQAASSGTPIADAFRQQGIIIPPAGTAVIGPVDPSRLSQGDIGMFTDRYALAVGKNKALLDGQIQQVANVRGPSFLGWQHPPTLGEPTGPTPTPTRPSATVPT